jgi:glycosyltransferase involved in cell wall biosynthesis
MQTPSSPPAVSVLIPVYNGGGYFAAALDSILAQTFTDFECIVLDDGSTDGSGELAQRRALADPRLRVVRRENRGLVATLNELLALARGELIARMDADDIALPDRLERQVRFMAAHPEVACLGGAYILMDEGGRPITLVRPLLDDAAIQDSSLRGHCNISHPTAMMRAELARALGGYRPEYYPAEDLDLWLRMGEHGALANLPEPMIFYRIHAGSISAASAQGRQRDAGRRGCEDAWRRRGRGDLSYEAGSEWRAGTDAESRMRFTLQYGWSAYQEGFRRTAVVYGLRALRLRPLDAKGWMLLGVALLKPRPRSQLV